MYNSRIIQTRSRAFIHLIFWLFAFVLLTYIYGVAFDSFALGAVLILLLLPVHIAYFYSLNLLVLPELFRGRFFMAALKALLLMAVAAVVYRFVEISCTDPYIFQFYRRADPHFNWSKLEQPWWHRMRHGGDFVNAIERSNVVVWIGITLKFFTFWQERRHAVLQAELNALKGQLHPHFLFNSLNNLYALSLDKAPQTPEVILGLSNILRYVIYECRAELVLLHKEVAILKDYIRLEKLRYEERLDLNMVVGEQLEDWQITPLLMLPLIENAFKHGVGETVDNGWINIDLQVIQQNLLLKVSNSKPLTLRDEANESEGHIGLSNVQHRLKILYPDAHKLEWIDAEDCFIIELLVPLQKRKTA